MIYGLLQYGAISQKKYRLERERKRGNRGDNRGDEPEFEVKNKREKRRDRGDIMKAENAQ